MGCKISDTRLDLIRCASSERNMMYKTSDKQWLYKTLEILKKAFEKTLGISKDFTKDFINFKRL